MPVARRLVVAVGVVLLGTAAVLSAPFVQAEAGSRLPDGSVNSRPASRPAAPPPVAASPSSSAPVTTRPSTQPGPSGGSTAPSVPPDPRHEEPISKVIYLTFDDGPHPVWTQQILDVLAANRAHATFFELGQEVARYPHLRDAVLAAGNRVGNHTYDHKSLPGLSNARVRSEIARGPRALCLRPPFGALSPRVRALAAKAGQHIQLWDVDTRDWDKPGVAAITEEILRGAHDGAVILMHDGGGDRSQTVAALRAALPRLAAQGYSFRVLPGC